jgi:hypothetical protein
MECMNTAFDNCPPLQRSPAVPQNDSLVADAALAGGRRRASIGVIKTKLADATVAEVMQACSQQVSAWPARPGASILYLF